MSAKMDSLKAAKNEAVAVRDAAFAVLAANPRETAGHSAAWSAYCAADGAAETAIRAFDRALAAKYPQKESTFIPDFYVKREG